MTLFVCGEGVFQTKGLLLRLVIGYQLLVIRAVKGLLSPMIDYSISEPKLCEEINP